MDVMFSASRFADSGQVNDEVVTEPDRACAMKYRLAGRNRRPEELGEKEATEQKRSRNLKMKLNMRT